MVFENAKYVFFFCILRCWCSKSNHTSPCKYSTYLFLFYTTIFPKHPHQFIYYTLFSLNNHFILFFYYLIHQCQNTHTHTHTLSLSLSLSQWLWNFFRFLLTPSFFTVKPHKQMKKLHKQTSNLHIDTNTYQSSRHGKTGQNLRTRLDWPKKYLT